MTAYADDTGDPFTDRGVRLVLIALALLMLFTLGSVAIIYYGDSFAKPSWSEWSMPPPKLY